jgi:O-acetyl-ADP-ribose deacetylase (regulator of RNase III)
MAALTVIRGDITEQRVDVIVNAANRAMRGGGGVDGAIHRAGGPAVLDDCVARFPRGLATGDAGWTTAGELPARWVIHTVGPNHSAGERDRGLLASCYRRALEVADELAAFSVAFPLISAGIYGWPKGDAIEVAIDAILAAETRVDDIRLIAFDAATARQMSAILNQRMPPATDPGSIGALFDEQPRQWGLRGDVYLWGELRARFATTPVPHDLRGTLESALTESIGVPLDSGDESVYIADLNPGHGMSAGHVHLPWWRDTALPLLLERAGRG